MTTERKIKRAVKKTDKWLLDRQKKHMRMVEKAIKNLQNDIIDKVNLLSVSKGGRLEGLKVNLKQAQKIHRDIELIYDKEFKKTTRKIIEDFKFVEDVIEENFTYLNESVRFTGMDRTTMEVLRDGYWREYLSIGEVQKNKVIQALYNQVIAGEKFSTLVNTIEQTLMGSDAVGVTGRPLAQYSRLYARDMVMNYQQEVTLKKAEDINLRHFLYVGDIIATTRDFCRRRVGKYYTKKQIESWTYRWAGKAGPAMTYRGGYNCRHHWQPIRPEWLEGKKKINVADWNLEQREKG